MTGIERIAAERQRQIEVEGWTPEHDAQHATGELSAVATFYSELASLQCCDGCAYLVRQRMVTTPKSWPWDVSWWKPSDNPIRNLEKAGALIAAEIDRLQRVKEVGDE